MKKLLNFRLLVLIGVLITSINQAWGAATNFTTGECLFLQADGDGAWESNAKVKIWFHTEDNGGTALEPQWIRDWSGDGSGKMFYVIVPSGSNSKARVQRWSNNNGNFGTWWNATNDINHSDRSGNVITAGSNSIAWRNVTYSLKIFSSINSWAASLGTLTQTSGTATFTYTISNHVATATSYDFKVQDSYGGWLGASNTTLSGLVVGATYDIVASFDLSTKTLTMTKTQKTFEVTASSADDDMGSVDPTSAFVGSSAVTFTALPKTGYHWTSWDATGGASPSNAATSSVTATADGTITANFAPYNYTTSNNIKESDGETANGQYNVNYNATSISYTSTPSKTGHHIAGLYKEKGFTNQIVNSDRSLRSSTSYTTSGCNWNQTSAPDLFVKWTANTYYVSFDRNDGDVGSGGDDMSNQTFTYGEAQSLTTNTYTKTGYNFAGWATEDNGSVAYTDGQSVSNLTDENGATFPLFAVWTAKKCTLNLDVDELNQGDIEGATTSQIIYYDGATTTVPNRPTAANGYALDGYYTYPLGEGVKVINADGTWIAEVDDYTDGSKNWVHDGDVTLYAYYKKAAITSITFTNGAVMAASTSKTVTARIEPTPTGTTTVCWRVLYNNDNPMETQPTFTPANAQGEEVDFISPSTSGMYKMEAVLHLGSGCEGETLDSVVANFQVASDHNVTIQYNDASGNVIAASTTVTGKPLSWSEDDIEAPDIFGYTFDHWDAGDGVTIKAGGVEDLTTSTSRTIKIKAVYDGRLTAVYNQNDMIYFKNTLGWSDVYVHFLPSSYWNNTNGSGNSGKSNCNKHMTRIGETDTWFFDYGAVSITPSLYIAFTSASQDNKENFESGVSVVYPANYQDDINTDKSSENGFKALTPMFVPLAGQTKTTMNSKADYYNRGYWTTYTAGTGYTLEIYNSEGNSLLKSIPFTSETDLMPMAAVADLEAGQTYKFQIRRGGTSTNGIYYGNGGDNITYATFQGSYTAWEMINTMDGGFKMAGIETNAAGDYTFHLGYSANGSGAYRLRINVDYPIATGDYRLLYKDNVHTNWHPSAIIPKANAKDTVSFFVRTEQAAYLKLQKCSVAVADGSITWTDTVTWWNNGTGIDAAVTQDSVYNICLTHNAYGELIIENVEAYTGNFYIRTDCANNKWDNYRSPDHMMTYSEYADKNSDYTHYFMSHAYGGTNIKFVVANDYSPCISDTLKQQATYRGGDATHVDANGTLVTGVLSGETSEANIRFMWDRSTNEVKRAYLAPAKNDGSKFLVLRGSTGDNLKDKNGNILRNETNNNHLGGDYCMQFVDDENWIYEADVKVVSGSFVKLYAHYHTTDYYYKGLNNDDFNGTKVDGVPNAISLLGGDGSTTELIHVIYDFKTDRLVSAWTPTGNISTVREINADVMFVREHQGDIQQLTFSKGDGTTMGAITKITTAYGVLRFNKWTLNNKDKSTHEPLDPLLSRYERDLFYVSFPFKVAMNEVFGFGTYGVHWIIEEYDGAARAREGYWADSESFWKFIFDRRGKYFEPNQGYIIALDLDELGESSSVWDNGVETVELYFPSYGKMGDITNTTVEYNLPAHECTINRPTAGGNRTIKDSHWNVMSVPTYVNTSSVSFTNDTWTPSEPNYLYEWNSSDNSLTARSSSGYTYHAMHAYMVQYYGKVTWTATSVTPSSIAARMTDTPDKEYKLELISEEQVEDQTFVRMTDNEGVTSGFEFNYDLSKEMNKNRANIYTLISTTIDSVPSITEAAANVQPQPLTTTIVPVGVKIAANGEYAFSMPEGTNGGDVWLIDNANSSRTNLGLMDYTVNLTVGTYEGRFSLEFPVQNVVTEIENAANANANANAEARKVFVGGRLYILRDGKAYDATGAQVR